MKEQYTIENGKIISRETEFKPYIERIIAAESLNDIAVEVNSLVEYSETLDGLNMFRLCYLLTSALNDFAKPYENTPKSKKHNVIIVPPKDSPQMLLHSYICSETPPVKIVERLETFVKECAEFSEPSGNFADEEEINSVLRAAQRRFRILDVIAAKRKLNILRINVTHSRLNSAYGFSNGQTGAGWILLYNLTAKAGCDAVYVAAHELGHALHLALTGDCNVAPDGFDKFNAQIHPNTKYSEEENQENFANAVAFVVLGGSLKKHIPKGFAMLLLPIFSRYINKLTSDYLAGSVDFPVRAVCAAKR